MNIGQKVRITIPKNTESAKSVAKYNGKVTVVKGIRHYRIGDTYILYGCKSDYGIPYEFIREWLVPIIDEVTE